ncbi:unnamed protein product [Sympodiomycopsis kandeliae]
MSRGGRRDSHSQQRSQQQNPQHSQSHSQSQFAALADVLSSSQSQQSSQQPSSSTSNSRDQSYSQSYGGSRVVGPFGAPSGRVQAGDFQPPPGSFIHHPHSPVLSSRHPGSPQHSPVYSRHPEGSVASLSSLGSDEGVSHVYERGGEEEDDEDEDDDTRGRDPGASVFSEAATMFDPNLYLHAQEAWNHWQQQQTHHRTVLGAEDDLEQDVPNESSFSRVEQMSERASLLSSSLAQRRKYGTIPQPLTQAHPGESALASSIRHLRSDAGTSAHHLYAGAGLSAINEQGANTATMRDAMKTADIGGNPGSNLGLLLVAVAQLCYSVMNLFVTLLDEKAGPAAPGKGPDDPPITALEIVGVECFIIWLGATAAMLVFKTPHVFLGPPGVRLLLVARGVFGFLSTLFVYLALGALSLSDATAITFLGPLATGLAASAVLGEPFTRREQIAGVGSLFGVLLIARPGAIFGDRAPSGPGVPSTGGDTPIEEDPGLGDGSDAAGTRVYGVIVALLAVLAMAGAWVSLRTIGRSASTYHSISYFALVSWTLSFALMLLLKQSFVLPSNLETTFYLFSIGLFSLLAQVFQTIGLQRETASRAAMMSYLQIIFATAFQVLLLGTPLEWLSVAGSVLVLANGAWVASAKNPEDLAGGH